MSVEILARSQDNTQAREAMRSRGLDCATPLFTRVLRKMHIAKGVNVGLLKKSWDVLRTVEFVEQHISKNTPILDVGAHTSEVLLCLKKMGFSDLTGIDLNPALLQMPNNQEVKYLIGNYTNTDFPNESFGAITAISVIEHEFRGPKIFREMARILKTGGYLIGSTDYWPEKVDTKGVVVYGMDWTIFSKDELLNLTAEAGRHGLVPVGPLHFDASEATVRWLRKNYTFAWFAFQKVRDAGMPAEKGRAS